MASSDKTYYIPQFAHRISFDFRLMGMRVPFTMRSGRKGTIIFPLIYDYNGEWEDAKLGSPVPIDILNMDQDSDDWGIINCFIQIEGKFWPEQAYLNSFLIESEPGKERRNPLQVEEQYFVSRLIRALVCICPKIVKDQEIEDFRDYISSFSQCGDSITIQLPTACIYSDHIFVDYQMLSLALANVYNEINLQYELMYQAYLHETCCNYRNAVLAYATIVDATLKRTIYKNLKSNAYSSEIKRQYDNSHGYKGFMDCLRMMKIPTYNSETIDSLMLMRNSIIHEGIKCVKNDLKNYYQEVLEFLRFYKVPVFENENKPLKLELSLQNNQ